MAEAQINQGTVYSGYRIPRHELAMMEPDEMTSFLGAMRDVVARECELLGQPLADDEHPVLRVSIVKIPGLGAEVGTMMITMKVSRPWPSTDPVPV